MKYKTGVKHIGHIQSLISRRLARRGKAVGRLARRLNAHLINHFPGLPKADTYHMIVYSKAERYQIWWFLLYLLTKMGTRQATGLPVDIWLTGLY